MSCEYCEHCRAEQHRTEAEIITLATIIAAVAHTYRLDPESLRGRSRPQYIAYARQLVFYLAREMTSLSFPAIGDYFNRDHSTVHHGDQKIRQRIAERPIFAGEVQRLRERIEQERRAS